MNNRLKYGTSSDSHQLPVSKTIMSEKKNKTQTTILTNTLYFQNLRASTILWEWAIGYHFSLGGYKILTKKKQSFASCNVGNDVNSDYINAYIFFRWTYGEFLICVFIIEISLGGLRHHRRKHSQAPLFSHNQWSAPNPLPPEFLALRSFHWHELQIVYHFLSSAKHFTRTLTSIVFLLGTGSVGPCL